MPQHTYGKAAIASVGDKSMSETTTFAYKNDDTVPLADYQALEAKYAAERQKTAQLSRLFTSNLVHSNKALLSVDHSKETKQTILRRHKVLDQIDMNEPVVRATHISNYINGNVDALTTRKAVVSPIVDGEPEPKYSLLTRTQNRAKALADYMKETGKASLKTSEAKAYLEGLEGHKLHSMSVIRAMRLIPAIVGAVLDHLGGRRERRLRVDLNSKPQKDNGVLRSRRRGPPKVA